VQIVFNVHNPVKLKILTVNPYMPLFSRKPEVLITRTVFVKYRHDFELNKRQVFVTLAYIDCFIFMISGSCGL